jgi:rare lipoprotein A
MKINMNCVFSNLKENKYPHILAFLTTVCVGMIPMSVDAQSATYYHPSLSGRTKANGQRYNPNAMTAASNNYRLGQRVRVTNRKTGRSVVVTITDRCGNCSIDLSTAAFRQIAPLKQGRVSVRVDKL